MSELMRSATEGKPLVLDGSESESLRSAPLAKVLVEEMTGIHIQGTEGPVTLRQAVQVAQDFKYWLDIQKPGLLFHPEGGDVRDCEAYKRASVLLAELVAQLDIGASNAGMTSYPKAILEKKKCELAILKGRVRETGDSFKRALLEAKSSLLALQIRQIEDRHCS